MSLISPLEFPGLRRSLRQSCSFVLAGIMTLTLSGCSLTGSGSESDGMDPNSEYALNESDLNAQREGRYGDGSIPRAEAGGIFRDVNFDFDSADISEMARQNIEYNIEILRANPNVKIQLEGHCDERGTAEYNMALGSKRAQAVNDILASYGISRDRIETISYGEEVPLDASSSELAWAKNRRVHFSGYR